MSDDILDTTSDGAQTAPVDINDLVNVTPLTNVAPPIAATRNLATKTALLAGDPDNATSNYQQIMSEANQGSTATIDKLSTQISQQVQSNDIGTTMNILANPNISIDQKQQVVNNYSQSAALKDTGMTVHTQLLQQPSAGETPDAENARLSVADSFQQMYQATAVRQGIVNSFKDADDATSPMTHFWNAAAQLIPFGSSVVNDKIYSAVAAQTGISDPWWRHFDELYRGGHPIAELRDQVNSLPPQQQIAFAGAVRDAVKNKSGLLFGSDNQSTAYQKINDILGTGTYGNGSEFLDNTFSLLDTLGAGGLATGAQKAVQAGARLVRGGDEAATAARGAEPFVGPGGAGSGGATEPSFGQPSGGTRATPGRGPAPDVEDVAFNETPKTTTPTQPSAPPSSQLANPQAKITAPVDQVAPASRAVPQLPSSSKEDLISRVAANNTVAETNPASVAQIAQNSNPEAARDMHSAVYQAQDDTIANALYGTSRTDALASDVFPQAATNSGIVTSKVADIDSNLRAQGLPDSQSLNIINSSGGAELTKGERAAARANVVNDFGNAEGLRMNTAMSSIQHDGNLTSVNAVYEAPGGSFSDAQQAVNQTKFALRGQGVLDSDITVLAKNGLDHVPIKLEDIPKSFIPDGKPGYNFTGKDGNKYSISYDTDAGDVKAYDSKGQQVGFLEAAPLKGSTFSKENGSQAAAMHVTASERRNGLNSAMNEIAARHIPGFTKESNMFTPDGQAWFDRGANQAVKLEPAGLPPGDYKIQVNLDKRVSYLDLGDTPMDKLSVKGNLTDRSPTLAKMHVSDNVLSGATMLDRTITGSAAIADRQATRLQKRLLQMANDFSDHYAATPAYGIEAANARKAKIDAYIREANYNEIAFDRGDLNARGFSPHEIETLSKFRNFWDNHYALENMDLVRTMDRQGYKIFKNDTTELHARPIAKNSNIGRMYDPATDTVRSFSKEELDHIYEQGGTQAEFRASNNLGGEDVTHMVSRETPTEYLRKFRDTDKVLNYRNGYYQLQYKAPKFVDLVKRGSNNQVLERRTVAVAGDTREAQFHADRMNLAHDGEGKYEVRSDDRALTRDRDEAYTIDSAGGRISQRHRGKLLEDASGLNRLGDGSYVVNPSEAAMRASRSISGRLINSVVVDTAKERFVQQFGEFLKDEHGTIRYPNTMGDIAAVGDNTSKALADARTTWSYIDHLQSGQINAMDQIAKDFFNGLGDGLGDLSVRLALNSNRTASDMVAAAERIAKMAATKSVTGTLKSGVMSAYISTNIPRQLLVQPYQATRTFAYNPTGWLNSSIPRLVAGYAGPMLGLEGHFHPQSALFRKFVEDSGLLSAIDQSNLVRGTLLQAAESGKGSVGSRILQTGRKYGFDMGESVNQLVHAAAVFDRYGRLGKDLKSIDVQHEMTSEIDALTGGFTKSNDQRYNSGSMSALLQFAQVGQKILLTYTNRGLTAGVRARMFVGDMLLYGAPVGLVQAFLGKDVLPPDHPEVADMISHGILVSMYNKTLNSIYGSQYKGIDFSALDPRNLDGWQKLGMQLMGQGGGLTMMGLVKDSPIGSLVNSRMTDAIKGIAKYFSHYEDWDGGPGGAPETLPMMLNSIAKVASGWNNAWKAKIMLETGKRVDQYGITLDENTTNAEAIAQVFGMGGYSQKDIYDFSTENQQMSKDHKQQVIQAYNDIKKHYADAFSQGISDPAFITGVTGAALTAFKDDPNAQQLIFQQMQHDMAGPEQDMMKQIIQRAGLPDDGALLDQIHNLPSSMDQYKPAMVQAVTDMRNAKDELKQQGK